MSANYPTIYYRHALTDAIVHLISSNKQEVQVFAEQFKEDWETFLLMRAKELVPGRQCCTLHLVITSILGPLVHNYYLKI